MSIHRMKKRITRQAVNSPSAPRGIMRGGASVATNDVVTGISGMRWVIDPKLSVIEDIEALGAEFEISFAKDLEVLQKRKIEIRTRGISERIPPAVSEG